MRVFSSAYGSTAPATRGARSRGAGAPGATSASSTADDPFVAGRLRRSWSPIALCPRQRPEEAALLRRLRLGYDRLRKVAERLGEVGVLVVEDDRLPLVHAERNGAIGGDVMPDLHPECVLDLARFHADLRVGAIEDDADAIAGEREHLERLQRQLDVLQRRDVETAQQEQLVG